jgi:hypothetical protein
VDLDLGAAMPATTPTCFPAEVRAPDWFNRSIVQSPTFRGTRSIGQGKVSRDIAPDSTHSTTVNLMRHTDRLVARMFRSAARIPFIRGSAGHMSSCAAIVDQCDNADTRNDQREPTGTGKVDGFSKEKMAADQGQYEAKGYARIRLRHIQP